MSDTLLRIQVECYSGYMAEETPRRLLLGRRRVEIVEILDRWLAPDHRYFKLVGDDGSTYILRHDVTAQHWNVISCERRECGSTSRLAGEKA